MCWLLWQEVPRSRPAGNPWAPSPGRAWEPALNDLGPQEPGPRPQNGLLGTPGCRALGTWVSQACPGDLALLPCPQEPGPRLLGTWVPRSPGPQAPGDLGSPEPGPGPWGPGSPEDWARAVLGTCVPSTPDPGCWGPGSPQIGVFLEDMAPRELRDLGPQEPGL